MGKKEGILESALIYQASWGVCQPVAGIRRLCPCILEISLLSGRAAQA